LGVCINRLSDSACAARRALVGIMLFFVCLSATAESEDDSQAVAIPGTLSLSSENRTAEPTQSREYKAKSLSCACNGRYSFIWFPLETDASGAPPSSVRLTYVAVRGDLSASNEYIDFKLSPLSSWNRYQGGADSSNFTYYAYRGIQPAISYESGGLGFYIDLNISEAVNQTIDGVPGFFEILFEYEVSYAGGGGAGGGYNDSPPQPPRLDSITAAKDSLTLNLTPPSSGGEPARYLGYCERLAGSANSSTSAPVSITDNGYSNSSITPLGKGWSENTDFVVGDVHGTVNISHSWIGDLELTLISPDLTWVTLWTGDSLDSRTSLTIDFSLPDFNGLLADGVWRLQIQDRKSGDAGTLQSWSIRFDYKELVNSNTPWGSGTSVTSVTINPLLNGATYLCYALTQNYIEAVSAASNTKAALVGGVPGKPTISVEPEDRAALISVASLDDGGLPIIEYDAVCESADGVVTKTSESKSFLVSPLSNDVGYLCKARARNVRGWGPYSNDVKVRPGEPPPAGLPLWLMYQAYEISQQASGSGGAGAGEYCDGYDGNAADCSAKQNFDPWIAGTTALSYSIRDGLTEVFPFTLPARQTAATTRYGYLQVTSGEPTRDAEKEDIFHVWFSETPNGPVLAGNNCDWYVGQASQLILYWTQDNSFANQYSICDLGETSRVLYVNFETRCYAPLYDGICNDNNKQKSSRSYQFDALRAVRGY